MYIFQRWTLIVGAGLRASLPALRVVILFVKNKANLSCLSAKVLNGGAICTSSWGVAGISAFLTPLTTRCLGGGIQGGKTTREKQESIETTQTPTSTGKQAADLREFEGESRRRKKIEGAWLSLPSQTRFPRGSTCHYLADSHLRSSAQGFPRASCWLGLAHRVFPCKPGHGNERMGEARA